MLFDAEQCNLKSTHVYTPIESWNVRIGGIVFHPNRVVVDPAISQCNSRIDGVAHVGFVFDFPSIVDAGQEGVQFYHILEIGIFIEDVEVGIGQGVGFYLCPSILYAHGPTVSKVILVSNRGGFLRELRFANIPKRFF